MYMYCRYGTLVYNCILSEWSWCYPYFDIWSPPHVVSTYLHISIYMPPPLTERKSVTGTFRSVPDLNLYSWERGTNDLNMKYILYVCGCKICSCGRRWCINCIRATKSSHPSQPQSDQECEKPVDLQHSSAWDEATWDPGMFWLKGCEIEQWRV